MIIVQSVFQHRGKGDGEHNRCDCSGGGGGGRRARCRATRRVGRARRATRDDVHTYGFRPALPTTYLTAIHRGACRREFGRRYGKIYDGIHKRGSQNITSRWYYSMVPKPWTTEPTNLSATLTVRRPRSPALLSASTKHPYCLYPTPGESQGLENHCYLGVGDTPGPRTNEGRGWQACRPSYNARRIRPSLDTPATKRPV